MQTVPSFDFKEARVMVKEPLSPTTFVGYEESSQKAVGKLV